MPSCREVNSGRGGCFAACRHFLVRRQHGPAQAAVLFFHLDEARQHGARAQLAGIAAIDARQQRIGEPIDNLRSEVPLHELRDGFIVLHGPRRMQQLPRHAELGAPGEQRRQRRRDQLRGHHEHQAVRHDDQPAMYHNVGLALRVVGADELIAHAELFAERSRPGFFGEERIGAGFDQAAFDAIGDTWSRPAAVRSQRACIPNRLRRRAPSPDKRRRSDRKCLRR